MPGRTPGGQGALAGGRRAEDFRLPAAARATAPALADAIDQHLMSLGEPDPARRPTTAAALAAAQRLRERLVAAHTP